MKKIALSKETLRVLTAQETRHVGGGADSRVACETAWDQMCLTHYFSCADDCNTGTESVGCPPPQTQGCPTGACTGACTGTGTGTGGTGTGGTGTNPPTHTV
jgi:hypothetical protein